MGACWPGGDERSDDERVARRDRDWAPLAERGNNRHLPSTKQRASQISCVSDTPPNQMSQRDYTLPSACACAPAAGPFPSCGGDSEEHMPSHKRSPVPRARRTPAKTSLSISLSCTAPCSAVRSQRARGSSRAQRLRCEDKRVSVQSQPPPCAAVPRGGGGGASQGRRLKVFGASAPTLRTFACF